MICQLLYNKRGTRSTVTLKSSSAMGTKQERHWVSLLLMPLFNMNNFPVNEVVQIFLDCIIFFFNTKLHTTFENYVR